MYFIFTLNVAIVPYCFALYVCTAYLYAVLTAFSGFWVFFVWLIFLTRHLTYLLTYLLVTAADIYDVYSLTDVHVYAVCSRPSVRCQNDYVHPSHSSSTRCRCRTCSQSSSKTPALVTVTVFLSLSLCIFVCLSLCLSVCLTVLDWVSLIGCSSRRGWTAMYHCHWLADSVAWLSLIGCTSRCGLTAVYQCHWLAESIAWLDSQWLAVSVGTAWLLCISVTDWLTAWLDCHWLAVPVGVAWLLCISVCDWLSGMKQMFSQGMADVLLDACSDFWDGHDIRPLGHEERYRYAVHYGCPSAVPLYFADDVDFLFLCQRLISEIAQSIISKLWHVFDGQPVFIFGSQIWGPSPPKKTSSPKT